MRVCIFVLNNCTVDSRILRQARTFAAAGHETVVLATRVGDVPAVEQRDGFEIRRIPVNYTWEEGYPRLFPLSGPLGRSLEQMTLRLYAPRPAAQSAATPAAGTPTGHQARKQRPFAVRATRRVLRRPLRFARIKYRRARSFRIRSVRYLRRLIVRRGLLPTRYRQLDRRLAREAIAFGGDVYWANDVTTVRAAHAAARATHGVFVFDAHEVIWDAPTVAPWPRRMWGFVERVHVRKADHVFTVCQPIAQLMADRYHVPLPTVVLNTPFLADTKANPPSRSGSPLNAYRGPGEKLVLFHGSLSPWRGLEQLVEAIGILPSEYRLVVLGHGKFRTTLEQLVQSLELQDRVTFLDSVPPVELPAWLAGADVGLIPYQRQGRNHEYSTPNKLFEYMHIGIPIVVNDLPEIRRIVTEVGFGVITDCSDPAAIAKAILELCSDPARWEEMRANALAGAPRYAWEAQEPLILEVATGAPRRDD